MKNSFIHSLFSEVVLHPAIRHSLANPLGDNPVNLLIRKSIIHKPAILLYHIFILIYCKTILFKSIFILIYYKTILFKSFSILFYYKTILLIHKTILLIHKIILFYCKTILLNHKIIFFYCKTILLNHKIVLFLHKFLHREIIPDFIPQKSFLFIGNILPPRNHPVLILQNAFLTNVIDPQ
jgi:hypothetical protein